MSVFNRFSGLLLPSYVLLTMLGPPAALYCLASSNVLYWCYQVLVGIFTFTAVWVALESLAAVMAALLGSTSPRTHSNKVVAMSSKEDAPCKVTLIVPAYMNNEVDIIDETLTSYGRLNCKGLELTIWLVFNMRNPDAALQLKVGALVKQWEPAVVNGVHFRVFNNEQSRSKCDNVNFALDNCIDPETQYVGIFDADHQPTKDNVLYALQSLKTCDIVQGHCSIRNYKHSLLTRIVAVEFEDIYNVGHEGRTALYSFGVFGGSNGIWKYSLMKEIKMDKTMLTEDIDSSIRSTLQSARIRYNRNMISAELAPETWEAWHHQRLRWSHGWLQVSMRHFIPGMISRNLSIRQKVAVFLLFMWRELFSYLVFHPIALLLACYSRFGNSPLNPYYLSTTILCCLLVLLKVSIVYGMSNGDVSDTGIGNYLLYALVWVPYQCVLNMIHVESHARQVLGVDTWVTTSRGSAAVAAKPPAVLDGKAAAYTETGIDAEGAKHVSSVTKGSATQRLAPPFQHVRVSVLSAEAPMTPSSLMSPSSPSTNAWHSSDSPIHQWPLISPGSITSPSVRLRAASALSVHSVTEDGEHSERAPNH